MTIDRYERLASEGMRACRDQAAALGLRMKLVEVFCSFHRRQMTFVYTADDRIDFRELVRLLARRFGGRIEMRQVGVRDEASRLGRIDTCGLVLCCAAFFDRSETGDCQARILGLPVDDPKLLGVCGRLKCCLLFEAMESQPVPASSKPSSLINPSRSRLALPVWPCPFRAVLGRAFARRRWSFHGPAARSSCFFLERDNDREVRNASGTCARGREDRSLVAALLAAKGALSDSSGRSHPLMLPNG